MAKNTFTEDPSGSSSGSKPGWATQKPYRDSAGRKLNTAGDYRPESEVRITGLGEYARGAGIKIKGPEDGTV